MSFTDAIELRDHLADILQPYLGEWEDGSPRIHIVPPTPKLQPRTLGESTTSSELECIIRRAGAGEPRSLSGPQKRKEITYSCAFVNYADNTKLVNAMDRLDQDSQIIFARPRVQVDASIDVYEQTTVFIKTVQLINTIAA